MNHISIVGLVLGVLGMVAELAAVIPTGGASLTLSGAVLAGAGFLGAATGIASSLTEESNPQASAILGWVSMGFGAVSLGSSVLGKLARCTRQASASHMLTTEATEATETAEMPERVAVSGPPSPRIEHMQLLGRIPQEGLSEARQSGVYVSTRAYFDMAVRMGYVQEVISPAGSNFHTLQLTLPAGNAEFFPALDALGFDTTQGVSRMNNLVEVGGGIGAVDIRITAVDRMYAPFMNANTRNGTEFINSFRYDFQARNQMYSATELEEMQNMWATNGFSNTFETMLWRNMEYSRNDIFNIVENIAARAGRQYTELNIYRFYQQFFFR